MQQISVSELQSNLASIINKAQREPVLINDNGRNEVAIISMNDYEELVKIKNLRLKNLAEELGKEAQQNGLTLEILNDILNSED